MACDEEFLNSKEHKFISLFKEVDKALGTKFRKSLITDGITISQLNVIIALRKCEMCVEQKNVNQAKLAESLMIEPISLTKTIEKMEAQGLVIRVNDPHDKRAKLVSLNHESNIVKSIVLSMGKIGMGILSGALKGFTVDEIELLISMLSKMSSNLSE
jgi:DNA-binding MarR family transcriptional regulator